MPIPPKGDPRRPLHLAVRTCRVLGTLALVFGVCAVMSPFVGPRRGGMALAAPLMGLIFYGGPGAAYLTFAHSMRRRRFWAVVAGLSLTACGVLLMAMGAVTTTIMLLSGVFKSTGNGTPLVGIMWGCVAFETLVSVALGQLVYWLARSFPALKLAPVDDARGFDVLPVAVVPAGEGPAEGGHAAS